MQRTVSEEMLRVIRKESIGVFASSLLGEMLVADQRILPRN